MAPTLDRDSTPPAGPGHTPTPWRAAGARVLTEDGHVLFRPDTDQFTDEEYCQVLSTLEADARFVEHAVNNHEALLAALDGASRAYHDAAAHSGSWDTCKRFGCQGDRKLIAVAREVTP